MLKPVRLDAEPPRADECEKLVEVELVKPKEHNVERGHVAVTVCDHYCVKELPYIDVVRTSSTTVNNGDGPKSPYD